MALVDAKYRFIYYDVGSNGRSNDASVFNKSNLGRLLEAGQLKLPEAAPLPGKTESIPYFIIGDDAFGLKPWLMKPYPYKAASRPQRIFNKRLSKARRMVECAFGHLAARFQVFGSAIRLYPSKVEQITVTAVLLHNYLIDRNDRMYINRIHNGSITTEDLRGLRKSKASNSSSLTARNVRDLLCDYVNNEGKQSWQKYAL